MKMFPAGAGMNRDNICIRRHGNHVPRRRGDEPLKTFVVADLVACSPQARG